MSFFLFYRREIGNHLKFFLSAAHVDDDLFSVEMRTNALGNNDFMIVQVPKKLCAYVSCVNYSFSVCLDLVYHRTKNNSIHQVLSTV